MECRAAHCIDAAKAQDEDAEGDGYGADQAA